MATLLFTQVRISTNLLLPGLLIAAALAIPYPRFRVVLALLAGLLWTSHAIDRNLASRLDPAWFGVEVEIEGRVASIPAYDDGNARFLFETSNSKPGIPALLSLRWYRNAPGMQANETWRLNIRVLPPRGRLDFAGFDYERWLFARSIGALGSVRSGELLGSAAAGGHPVLGLRQSISAQIDRLLAGHQSLGMVKALAVGDRTGISDQQWRFLAASGTTHLLAISGMHIGMVALFGFWAGKVLFRFAPALLAPLGSQRLGIVFALGFAGFYALLSGFVVPAQRALLILLVILSGQLIRCRAGTMYSLLLALTGVIVLDPLTPLRTGFWLSFTAVFLLLFAAAGRPPVRGRWRQLLHAQWVVIVGMTPLTLYWFQQASLISVPSNLAAIPLISLLVVPLILISVVFINIAPGLAGFLLWLSAQLLAGLQYVLAALAGLPGIIQQVPAPGIITILMAMAGVLLVLAPRAVPGRIAGLVLVLPLVFTSVPALQPGTLELTLLDVGQGSAALLRSRNHLLLYDTGPGDGKNRQLVNSTINPAIQNTGFGAPDTIIVSHGDLDHAGGMGRLAELFPDSRWYYSLPNAQRLAPEEDCRTPLQWHRDGIEFTVLHPGPGLPYLGNDSSCVLRISTHGVSLLLPGDISEAVEQRLVHAKELAPGGIVVVPHHGSTSSSSHAFINATRPRLALISSGFLNRFKLPKDSTVNRYRAVGARVLSTADCGAIRVTVTADGSIDTITARQIRTGAWRYQAAPSC